MRIEHQQDSESFSPVKLGGRINEPDRAERSNERGAQLSVGRNPQRYNLGSGAFG